jgi:hypothetical protein
MRSIIIATDHFETDKNGWDVDVTHLGPGTTDLVIGFTDDAPVMEFNDLHFKYELRQGTSIKQYGTYPPPGVRYIRSDQKYIVNERLLNLKPDETYELYLYAHNDGKTFENTVSFISPRPTQPYESWTWDGDKWEPPVPHPEGEDSYTWNETDQKWDEDTRI